MDKIQLTENEIKQILDTRAKRIQEEEIIAQELKDIMRIKESKAEKTKALIDNLIIILIMLAVFTAFIFGVYVGRLS